MSTKRQPKIITQINIEISPEIKQAFEIESAAETESDTLTTRELFLDDHKNCPLCGSELLYTHVAHFASQTVNEEAHCEACNVRVKQNSHSLQ